MAQDWYSDHHDRRVRSEAMDEAEQAKYEAPGQRYLSRCGRCGAVNMDWERFCARCGQPVSDLTTSIEAEIGHLVYLRQQLASWRTRGLLLPEAETRLQADSQSRQQELHATLQPDSLRHNGEVPNIVAPVAASQQASDTLQNETAANNLQTLRSLHVPQHFAATGASASGKQTAPQTSISDTAQSVPPKSPLRTAGIQQFFQQNALKIVFAMATLLVLAALRSMLGWDWIGVVAMRLMPLIPFGLTAMFWAFGQKTRSENPWAGFVYHSLAAALLAFDVLAVDKYWLPVPLPVRLLLLSSAGTTTIGAGAMLWRWRETPYLHLFEAGIIPTLYAAVQMLRTGGAIGDLRPTPLWMFGSAYLLNAVGCLIFARASNRNNIPEVASTPVGLDRPASRKWQAAWTLWAHLSVLLIVVLSAYQLASGTVSPNDFVLLTLLTGVLYTVGAQLLSEARMVRVAGAFLAASGILWLNANQPFRFWDGFELLLLALSAIGLALSAFNSRSHTSNSQSILLARAFRQTARQSVWLATIIAWTRTLLGLILLSYPAHDAYNQHATAALLTFACGLFYLGFANSERKPDFLFAALTTWALTLVSVLAMYAAPVGGYALSLTTYGVLLCVLPLAWKRRATSDHSDPNVESVPVRDTGAQVTNIKGIDWTAPLRSSGQGIALVGILLAAALPLTHPIAVVWVWSMLTLSLGAALYAATARSHKIERFAYAATCCAAYASGLLTWHLLPPHMVSLNACLAPFTIVMSGLALYIAWSKHPAKRDTPAQFWHLPVTVSATISAAVGISHTLLMFLFGDTFGTVSAGMKVAHATDSVRFTLELLPILLSAAMLAASRRKSETDGLRRVTLSIFGVGASIAIGLSCGLIGGADARNTANEHLWGAWMLALGWLFWLAARGLKRWLAERDVWSADITTGGLAIAFCAALPLAFAVPGSGFRTLTEMLAQHIFLFGAFLLLIIESCRTRRQTLLPAIVMLTLLNMIGNAAPIIDASIVNRYAVYTLTLWALDMIALSTALMALSRRTASPAAAQASLIPLVLGCGFNILVNADHLSSLPNAGLTNLVWIVGGIGIATEYLRAALRTKRNEFSVYAACLLISCCLRATTLVWHIGVEWYALLVLPILAAIYQAGCQKFGTIDAAEYDILIGMPLHRTAAAASVLALIWCVGTVDGVLLSHPRLWITSLTMLVYGVLYGLLALMRRTPRAITASSLTLTAAYLHHLLTQTAFFDSLANSARIRPLGHFLSGPHFAFLAVQAAVLWLTGGWIVRRFTKRLDLAHPLLRLAGCLSVACSALALVTVQTSGEGHWTILTLGWAGSVCFGLWALEQGETWLHVGVWNLLAGWGLVVYDRVGANVQILDLYLLPVGLYLMAVGHLTGRRSRLPQARTLWWAGLLLTLTPSFLAYWERAADWHTVLFLLECLVAVLWGIGHRIRAFTIAGLGFACLFAAAVSIGHLPSTFGTLVTLFIGVSLFIIGYYALTHREEIQRMALAFETRWKAWQAWQ